MIETKQYGNGSAFKLIVLPIEFGLGEEEFEMPYKLLLSEEITPAVRRIALEQLKRARRSISSERNMQTGVHDARKNFKRLRALMRLSKPILGKRLYRAENNKFRDMGRVLAKPRSRAALLDILQKFSHRADMKPLKPLFHVLQEKIELEKNRYESKLEILAVGGFVERLDESINHWQGMTLPDAQFSDLSHGFATSYERARLSLEVAIKEANSFYLHEWRKDMQQTWRHMQIFTLIWPEDIMPRIRLAREISLLLGTAHDIDELLRYIKIHKKEIVKSKRMKGSLKAFRRAATVTERDLCLHAIERGRRLYALRSSEIEQAMIVYWQTAKAIQPLPSIALELGMDSGAVEDLKRGVNGGGRSSGLGPRHRRAAGRQNLYPGTSKGR